MDGDDVDTGYSALVERDTEVWLMSSSDVRHPAADSLAAAGVPYREYQLQDWPVPHGTEFDPSRGTMQNVAIASYRRWRDHQEVMQLAGPAKYLVVIEPGLQPHSRTGARRITLDDSPNAELSWLEVLDVATILTNPERYETAILACTEFARPEDPDEHPASRWLLNRKWELPATCEVPAAKLEQLRPALRRLAVERLVWVWGPLAYVIHRRGRERWLRSSYVGLPVPLFLANVLSTTILDGGLFSHFLAEHDHGDEESIVVRRQSVPDPGSESARLCERCPGYGSTATEQLSVSS